MRTKNQVYSATKGFYLSRRQLSILDFSRSRIHTQQHLSQVVREVSRMSEEECLSVLNQESPLDTPHTLHFRKAEGKMCNRIDMRMECAECGYSYSEALIPTNFSIPHKKNLLDWFDFFPEILAFIILWVLFCILP